MLYHDPSLGITLINEVLPSSNSSLTAANKCQLHATFYSTDLLEFAVKNKTEVLKIEKRLADMINDGMFAYARVFVCMCVYMSYRTIDGRSIPYYLIVMSLPK